MAHNQATSDEVQAEHLLDTQVLGKWGELLIGERACQWGQGEMLAGLRAAAGKAGWRQVFGVMAVEGHCTLARLRELADVFESFPTPESRRVDKPWTWHRAVRKAARRLRMDPGDVLADATRWNCGEREIAKLGVPASVAKGRQVYAVLLGDVTADDETCNPSEGVLVGIYSSEDKALSEAARVDYADAYATQYVRPFELDGKGCDP
jgi:hypothetical protein